MRSFSKLLLLLPLVIVAPAFLVGCGPGATVETTDDAAAEAEEAAELAADAEMGVGEADAADEE